MSRDKQHCYSTRSEWTGNLGEGTTGYRTYLRDHLISATLATALHEQAHRLCFIASSMNFPASIEPAVLVSG